MSRPRRSLAARLRRSARATRSRSMSRSARSTWRSRRRSFGSASRSGSSRSRATSRACSRSTRTSCSRRPKARSRSCSRAATSRTTGVAEHFRAPQGLKRRFLPGGGPSRPAACCMSGHTLFWTCEEHTMTRTIVITGASSGFGNGVAQVLAGQEYNLVLAARREDLIAEPAEEIKHSIAVPTDVASIDDMRHVHDRAIAEFGHIDVWINNAGVGAIGPFTEIPLEDQIRVVETNLIGVLNGSYLAMQHFREHRRGTLINIASIAGKVAVSYYGIYDATKSGVQFLSSSIRQELKQHGEDDDIHVCV